VASDSTYNATIDLVLGEHWVVVYHDARNRLNIRMVSKEDAWDFDIQKGMHMSVKSLARNRCKLLKVIDRPI